MQLDREEGSREIKLKRLIQGEVRNKSGLDHYKVLGFYSEEMRSLYRF